MAPSSAGLERLFSSMGYVHSDIRNRLDPERVRKLAFCMRLLNKSFFGIKFFNLRMCFKTVFKRLKRFKRIKILLYVFKATLVGTLPSVWNFSPFVAEKLTISFNCFLTGQLHNLGYEKYSSTNEAGGRRVVVRMSCIFRQQRNTVKGQWI